MKRLILGTVILAVVAGIAYWVTLGCCQVMGVTQRPRTLTRGLNFDPAQKVKVATLEKEFLARKQASCGTLCAKRAQMIQVLKQGEPDPRALNSLVEEIGREQTALEKATLDHLLAVSRHLDAAQRERLMASITEELRLACKATACGAAGECFVQGEKEKR